MQMSYLKRHWNMKITHLRPILRKLFRKLVHQTFRKVEGFTKRRLLGVPGWVFRSQVGFGTRCSSGSLEGTRPSKVQRFATDADIGWAGRHQCRSFAMTNRRNGLLPFVRHNKCANVRVMLNYCFIVVFQCYISYFYLRVRLLSKKSSFLPFDWALKARFGVLP